eukprot:m.892458 g.892458  ORF g.892458 m.892458 type:complete len:549 (-) comp23656_c1_seq9:3412-5058(-)
MGVLARALYSFEGDVGQGELVFTEGDTINILNQEIGEGWWEGSVNGGPRGLLPASYVELTGESVPDASSPHSPPGPPPAMMSDQHDDEGEFEDSDDEGDVWDEASDDDGDLPPNPVNTSHDSAHGGGLHPRSQSNASDFGRAQSIKKSKGLRTSAFVKAGAQDYMIGSQQVHVQESDMVEVVDTNGVGPGWKWPQTNPKYGSGKVCVSSKGKKKTTFKSHSQYDIKTGETCTVERRAKHFQWLHDRLTHKYTCICVPPLPDKTYSSKFGEEAEQKRLEKLTAWLERIMRHPVLRQDKLALFHFLTTPYGTNSTWKDAKRRAETDKLVGGSFFAMVHSSIACPRDAMKTINNFNNFHSDMRKAVDTSAKISMQHASRMAGAIKKEYINIGSGFNGLAEVFTKGNASDGNSTKLSMAFRNAADTMNSCAEIVKMQPRQDELPWMDGLKEYGSMLTQFGDALQSSKEAQRKYLEVDSQDGAVVPQKEKDALRERLDTIHTVALCEINHFHDNSRKDFKIYMQNYLQAQIDFHEKLKQEFIRAKQQFDALPF